MNNLTEMFSLLGETEAQSLTSACTESCCSSQESDSCEELCPGEGLKACVHQHIVCLMLRTQLHHVTQGMALVQRRQSETVILLPGVCRLRIREKGQETEDNRP